LFPSRFVIALFAGNAEGFSPLRGTFCLSLYLQKSRLAL
jgi:hypothetical protein